MRAFSKLSSIACLVAVAGCADPDGGLEQDGSTGDVVPGSTGDESDPTTTSTDESSGEPVPSAVGRCDYTSPFTSASECREFSGSAWTEGDVTSECERLSGAVTLGQGCENAGVLGRCILDEGADNELQIFSYGDDASDCEAQAFGCETFGGGTWLPTEICEDTGGTDTGEDPPDSSPFVQPTLECRDPIAGEPAGDGPDGQVCTWQLISASTEEGRRFQDYASCEVVLTQRPYYPAAPNEIAGEDERLDEPAYVAELDWVREQIEASACVCCHADSVTPSSASNWDIEAPGNWANTFYDSGLAMGAGWVDSTAFGAFEPEANNGFHRDTVGIPSTDPDRMRAFFEGELERRGRTQAEFSDVTPFGGPLYEQLIFEPGRCEEGEGVDPDGTVQWVGGAARYVYVLEAGSGNPTVPPNLDLPAGTKWRIDVPTDGSAVEPGSFAYPATPDGMSRRFPESGEPDALTPGEDYYLYVLRDIGIPATRCVFTFTG